MPLPDALRISQLRRITLSAVIFTRLPPAQLLSTGEFSYTPSLVVCNRATRFGFAFVPTMPCGPKGAEARKNAERNKTAAFIRLPGWTPVPAVAVRTEEPSTPFHVGRFILIELDRAGAISCRSDCRGNRSSRDRRLWRRLCPCQCSNSRQGRRGWLFHTRSS